MTLIQHGERKRMLESDFQTQVIELLKRRGHLVFVTKRRNDRRSFQNGSPDLIVCTRGQGLFYGIELKTDSGSQRESQKVVEKQFRDRGLGTRYVLLRPGGYMETLREWELV